MKRTNLENVELYGNKNSGVPKIIWILWFQGIEDSPYIVKKCLASWEKYNPSWKIIFLDDNNINEYIDTTDIISNNKNYISMASLSDVIRINLLNKYGGVWVDSTCYCCRPLDDWLSKYISEGFFVFCCPAIHSPISNWFMVSSIDSQITKILCQEVNMYWEENDFSNQTNSMGIYMSRVIQKLMRYCSYESSMFSILFSLSKSLKVYPYFCFHYIFSLTIRKNSLFKKQWNSVRVFNADIPHRLQHFGLFNAPSEQIKYEINCKSSPLYKLTWKYDKTMDHEDSTLHYLLER